MMPKPNLFCNSAEPEELAQLSEAKERKPKEVKLPLSPGGDFMS